MHRLICTALLISVPFAGMPVLAFASPPEAEEAEAPDEDPDMTRARDLFDSGVARYTASDYEAAIEFWMQAYALIPPTFENRLVKAELIYNVARAQQKWFEIDEDIKHLRQAREILGRYLGEVDDLYPAEQVALERQKVEDQISELDERITAEEEEAARREAELADRMRPKFDEKADARERKRNNAMIGSGSALTVVGLGAVGMLVSGIAMAGQAERAVEDLPLAADIDERQRQVSKGGTGNALILLGSVVGGVFLAAGVPLLVVGVVGEKKRKHRRREAEMDAPAPTLLPGGAGLMVGGRF